MQWLLAIPYLLIAGVLYWLTGVLTIVAFFTVLFTKQIPRGVFELMVPGLRWNLRGNAYAYFMTERYPPFVWGVAESSSWLGDRPRSALIGGVTERRALPARRPPHAVPLPAAIRTLRLRAHGLEVTPAPRPLRQRSQRAVGLPQPQAKRGVRRLM